MFQSYLSCINHITYWTSFSPGSLPQAMWQKQMQQIGTIVYRNVTNASPILIFLLNLSPLNLRWLWVVEWSKDVMLLSILSQVPHLPKGNPSEHIFSGLPEKVINGLNLIPPDQIPDWIERKKKVKMGRRIWAFSETNKRKARIEKDRQVGPKCSEFMKERSLQEKCRWSLGPRRQWNKIKKRKIEGREWQMGLLHW